MYDIESLQLCDTEKVKCIENLLEGLQMTDDTLERIRQVFSSEMDLALKMQPSSLQMENTYIPELPDGTESGTYLAMDLGGTNLRMLRMTLDKGQVVDEVVQHYPLPDHLRIGDGDALFDHLAQCVDNFAREQELDEGRTYSMGFTFSFPMRQSALDSGTLVTWTKSFNCPSVVGQDAVKILKKFLHKNKRTNIEIVAILNDTTGTLMHGALMDKNTRIGIVLGTGTNGCYMERSSRVLHWEQQRQSERHVIVDVEWGAFGDNGVLDFIKTEYDRQVDEGSLLKNSFTFEKYISGKYLGELCRCILAKLHACQLFLTHVPQEMLPQPWSFGSDNVSAIEQDNLDNSWDNTKTILRENYNASHYDIDDLKIIRYVCALISKRAAQLLALNTSVLLNGMAPEEGDNITIAIDGSVYQHHARLRQWIIDYTALWTRDRKTKYLLATDGSGKGAAVVAAIAEKLRRRNS
ncbi:hexokinase type 2-like [Haematobia irritans]|uniref:hexokinase type 2-like n=1 Tax=Haematobia irritans TaxID=7368 RepID=UPI003F4FBF63